MRGLILCTRFGLEVRGRMPLVDAFKRGLAAIAPPVILLGLGGYFVWSAMHGDRGLLAHEARRTDITAAHQALRQAEQERDAMERRVAGLRGNELDRDQLDERARALLNMLGRDDLVMPYAPERRLY